MITMTDLMLISLTLIVAMGLSFGIGIAITIIWEKFVRKDKSELRHANRLNGNLVENVPDKRNGWISASALMELIEEISLCHAQKS